MVVSLVLTPSSVRRLWVTPVRCLTLCGTPTGPLGRGLKFRVVLAMEDSSGQKAQPRSVLDEHDETSNASGISSYLE